MTRPRSLRGRLFLVLAAVAILPAAVALGSGALVLREFVLATGTAGPWQEVASSGRTLLDAVAALEDPSPEVLAAAAIHQEGLAESVRFSTLYALLSERVLALLPFFAVGLLAIAAGLALVTANWLSRSFSRPVEELLVWTGHLGAARKIPPTRESGASMDLAEFVALRKALRSTEEQLEEARRQEADRIRHRSWSEMARKVAHEIKNPLTPMSLAARTVAGSQDPAVAQAGDVLLEEIRRLDTLARSFAQFGRPPEGPATPVDLGELLSSLALRLSTEDTPIVFNGPAHGAVITGHLDALDRVARNLLANAQESAAPMAASRGKPAPVEVRLTPLRLVIEVQVLDRGSGIPPELLPRIWEPEFTTRRRGTGLGLALVRQAVYAHGGQVHAANREGGGAVFTVTLPRPDASDQEEA